MKCDIYAKCSRVTRLMCNTIEFSKYRRPHFFPGHVFIITLKDHSRGKIVITPVTRIELTGTKYQVISQGEASFLRVACTDRAALLQ